jgi:hypothetical protein
VQHQQECIKGSFSSQAIGTRMGCESQTIPDVSYLHARRMDTLHRKSALPSSQITLDYSESSKSPSLLCKLQTTSTVIHPRDMATRLPFKRPSGPSVPFHTFAPCTAKSFQPLSRPPYSWLHNDRLTLPGVAYRLCLLYK